MLIWLQVCRSTCSDRVCNLPISVCDAHGLPPKHTRFEWHHIWFGLWHIAFPSCMLYLTPSLQKHVMAGFATFQLVCRMHVVFPQETHDTPLMTQICLDWHQLWWGPWHIAKISGKPTWQSANLYIKTMKLWNSKDGSPRAVDEYVEGFSGFEDQNHEWWLSWNLYTFKNACNVWSIT